MCQHFQTLSVVDVLLRAWMHRFTKKVRNQAVTRILNVYVHARTRRQFQTLSVVDVLLRA